MTNEPTDFFIPIVIKYADLAADWAYLCGFENVENCW